MFVDFRLPERFQSKLRLRQSVDMQLDSFPGRIFKATIEAIDPLLDVNGRSVGVRAVLPNTMGEPMAQGRPGGPGGAAATGGPAGASSAPKPGAAIAAAATRPGTGAASARPAGGQPLAGGRGGSPARAAGPAQAASRPVSAGAATASGREPVDANGCPIQTDAPVLAATAPEQPRDPGAAGTGGGAGARPGAGAGRPGAGPSAGGRAGAGQAGGNPMPLRPGMFARVNTVFSIKEAAIVIPEEAIVPQGGRQFVFKVVDPSALPPVVPPAAERPPLPSGTTLVSMRQEVRLGVRQLGRVEVLDGLAEGETVVVAGHQRLQRDGTALRIVELGRPPGGGGGAQAGAPAGAASGAATAGSASNSTSAASSAVPSR